jgi:hypothetical protein
MAFASGAGTRLAYVPETVFGVVPSDPAFQEMRVTGSGLKSAKVTGVSKELSVLRDVKDITLLGIDASGDIPFEFSYGSMDDILAAALFGKWEGDILKNGSERQYFTIEETLDLGNGAKSYHRFPGSMISKLAMNIAAREVVSGTLSVKASREEVADAALTGSTYVPANTEPVSTASANVAELSFTGFDPPLVKSFTLEIDNSLRDRTAVGSLYSEEFGFGALEVKGTMEAYFQDNKLYKEMLAHGTGSFSFDIGNASGKKYKFTIPRFRFADGSKNLNGSDSDVMLSLPWQGILSPDDGCTLIIERGIA